MNNIFAVVLGGVGQLEVDVMLQTTDAWQHWQQVAEGHVLLSLEDVKHVGNIFHDLLIKIHTKVYKQKDNILMMSIHQYHVLEASSSMHQFQKLLNVGQIKLIVL